MPDLSISLDKMSTVSNGISIRWRIWTTVLENPHWGKSVEPFMNASTLCSSMYASIAFLNSSETAAYQIPVSRPQQAGAQHTGGPKTGHHEPEHVALRTCTLCRNALSPPNLGRTCDWIRTGRVAIASADASIAMLTSVVQSENLAASTIAVGTLRNSIPS